MPSASSVRRANHRAFALELGAGAPGARWVETPDELDSVLNHVGSERWLFKRAYGFAGRGQRQLSGVPSETDRNWLQNALELGVVAEPLLDIALEFSLHGWINVSGNLRLGRPCRQWVDRHRAWSSGQPASETELPTEQRSRLFDSAELVANALSEIGYFGPFGIDAYAYRDASGSVRFNPLSEINARYTMSWGLGMQG
jgi:phosphoribosylaminoimidazole carboxylase (NCAIR synthetase)